jgi:hypothetical protein
LYCASKSSLTDPGGLTVFDRTVELDALVGKIPENKQTLALNKDVFRNALLPISFFIICRIAELLMKEKRCIEGFRPFIDQPIWLPL